MVELLQARHSYGDGRYFQQGESDESWRKPASMGVPYQVFRTMATSAVTYTFGSHVLHKKTTEKTASRSQCRYGKIEENYLLPGYYRYCDPLRLSSRPRDLRGARNYKICNEFLSRLSCGLDCLCSRSSSSAITTPSHVNRPRPQAAPPLCCYTHFSTTTRTRHTLGADGLLWEPRCCWQLV